MGNLAVFLVVGSVAAAVGYLPWQVPALLVPWIGAVWLAGHYMYRAASPERSQWIETVSYCLDAVWLTAACFYLGGADWIASGFYVLLVITAAASLSMPKAVLVAAVAWVGFAWLSLGEATGTLQLPEFGADPGGGVPVPFAILTVVVQGTTLILALLLQQALLGALRRSEARHRAILGAASDMVVVLDRDGIIQGTSEVFADRTAFPIGNIVGTRFSDIVDSQHLDSWTRELRTACTGEHAPFEIAYRSTHANQGWIAGTLIPLPPEHGDERVLMIARDVSTEHRAVTTREAVLVSEVASARLASLDVAIREVVRDIDLSLRKVLHDVGVARPVLDDEKAHATLRTIADDVTGARDRAHELIERLDMFKVARDRPGASRKKVPTA